MGVDRGRAAANNIHVHDGVTEEEFVRLREGRDRALPFPALLLDALQVNIRGGRLPEPEDEWRLLSKIPLNFFRETGCSAVRNSRAENADGELHALSALLGGILIGLARSAPPGERPDRRDKRHPRGPAGTEGRRGRLAAGLPPRAGCRPAAPCGRDWSSNGARGDVVEHAPDRRRPAGRLRHTAGQRLHQWPWRCRPRPPFPALCRCHRQRSSWRAMVTVFLTRHVVGG